MSLHTELLPDPLPAEPLELVSRWLTEALRAHAQPNPNAMVLATASRSAAPSARVVLCKDIRPQPGTLAFFTNYRSRKAEELEANPRAAAVMHWDTLRRQVRLEGNVTRASAADSDAYFASRAWQSRIGAWASEQSAPLASRADLAETTRRTAARFGVPSPLDENAQVDPATVIPRPPHWGGYLLWVDSVELWVEGAGRLHDRARWTRSLTRTGEGFQGSGWTATRLNP